MTMTTARWILAALAGLLTLASPADGNAQTLPAQASPDCRLRIDTAATNWVIDGYDLFGGGAAAGAYDVLFVNQGERECRFYPRFDTDQATLGLRAEGGAAVAYTLLDTFGQYDATPVAGRTVRRPVNRPVVLVPGGQQLVRYLFTVGVDALQGDGLFTQRLLLTAEDLAGNPLTQRQVVVGINVLPSATLSLAGAFTRNGSQADIDLGDLSAGVGALPLALQVMSTRGYRLGIDSLNGGRLRLAGTDWSVPYALSIQGQPIRFGENGGYVSGNTPGIHRDSLPLSFTVAPVSDLRAGSYSDILTITVATL
ncbi:hypothetical protein FHT00_002804 [Sphingomonas insulae]|uniref:Spore coat protein U (SCPU) domain-containing protein n=1 Tax=Sphingomonas insulae TaxID=424800 RepID=A0ABP3SRV9_9SPHN|nr:hypothetical protein [Sphingomonas insulae]NIJ30831.1 hypothetical protein [Sphingomonas insulae]